MLHLRTPQNPHSEPSSTPPQNPAEPPLRTPHLMRGLKIKCERMRTPLIALLRNRVERSSARVECSLAFSSISRFREGQTLIRVFQHGIQHKSIAWNQEYSLLITHYSLLITHYSLLITNYFCNNSKPLAF
jgi:hypothetical protein